MASSDLIITFLNGNSHVVHRDSGTQVDHVRVKLEQEIKVEELMEIRFFYGPMILKECKKQ